MDLKQGRTTFTQILYPTVHNAETKNTVPLILSNARSTLCLMMNENWWHSVR